MSATRLTIEGQEIGIGEVWVHFKSSTNTTAKRFSLLIGGEYIVEVFDRRKEKPKEASWSEYILQQLRKFGTLAFDNYLRELKRIEEVPDRSLCWVITSIDSIKPVERGLLFEGSVEELCVTGVPVPRPIT